MKNKYVTKAKAQYKKAKAKVSAAWKSFKLSVLNALGFPTKQQVKKAAKKAIAQKKAVKKIATNKKSKA